MRERVPSISDLFIINLNVILPFSSQSSDCTFSKRSFSPKILFVLLSSIAETCPNHTRLLHFAILTVLVPGHGSPSGLRHVLSSLARSRDNWFESHTWHGCLVFVFVCVCVCVCAFFYVCLQVEALRRADHPPKESHRMSKI
jgi:hypothetical protein